MLGKGGTVLREIEQATGCKIVLNQDSRDLGYSIAQVHGNLEGRSLARQRIDEVLARALGGPQGQAGGQVEEQIQVEQNLVGYLLGKGGSLLREIEQESGAQIFIDQSTKNKGYSTVNFSGATEAVAAAKGRINASLTKARTTNAASAQAQTAGALRALESPLLTGLGVNFAAPKSRSGKGELGASLSKAPSSQLSRCEVTVQQKWIGWLLGKGGAVMKEIEVATGCKIDMDQGTKAMGYSTACLSGTSSQITNAYQMMQNKLKPVDHMQTGLGPLTLVPDTPRSAVAQEGGVNPEARQLVEVLVSVAQQLAESIGTPDLLRSTVLKKSGGDLGARHATLPPAARPQATALFGSMGHSTGPGFGSSGEQQQTFEMQVEQQWIGWIMGSGGKTIKELQAATGAKIVIDQSTKEMGYSTVKLIGAPRAVAEARHRVQASISIAKNQLGVTETTFSAQELIGESEMMVEQKYVGYLVGKQGAAVKDMEQASGVRFHIDQSTKEHGFSTLKLSGTESQRAMATRMVEERLAQAAAGAASA